MGPQQRPIQQAGHHVHHIGHLIHQTQQALDTGWDTGATQPADTHLAAIQHAARQARAALQPRPSRVRPYLLAA